MESPYVRGNGGADDPTKKRPAAAEGSAKGIVSLKWPAAALVTRQREREPRATVTVENMTKKEKQKFDDAMMMSENNEQLSLMVVNLKQNQTKPSNTHPAKS